MLLSIQQRYILEVLRKLGCVQRRQLQMLVQGRFPDVPILDRRMEAMLRQLRNGMGNVLVDSEFVGLLGTEPNCRRLEAVDVMLELSEGCPQDFSVSRQCPELLRFSLEGSSLRVFTVATVSDPVHTIGQARDSPGRVVWISDDGTAPPGLVLPRQHFFAARQPDGSHRFYGS